MECGIRIHTILPGVVDSWPFSLSLYRVSKLLNRHWNIFEFHDQIRMTIIEQKVQSIYGISLNGDDRAYPLRIMDWHEMANDIVGGVPVSLAYCTLCGAGIAFDGRVPAGDSSESTTYTFGSSGFLYRSNKLMYDRQSRTLWNQFTGQPVLGPLADEDISLELLPVVLTTWKDWVDQHPDTQVLDHIMVDIDAYAGDMLEDLLLDALTLLPRG